MEIKETLITRAASHGDYYSKSKTIQIIKDVMGHTPNWDDLPDDMKESLDMIATKIGRILYGDPFFHDSWHDIEGYARLVSDRLTNLPVESKQSIEQQIQFVWGTPVDEVTDE